MKYRFRSTFNRNLDMVNKTFWSNLAFPILLFLLPLLICFVSFISTKNIIIFNQSFSAATTIDIFIVGFLITPLFIRHFNNSIVNIFNRNKARESFYAALAIIFYMFCISVAFFVYSLLIFFLFSIKHFNEDVFKNGSDTPINHAYEFIFSPNYFYSNELGLLNFQSKRWMAFILFAFFSYFWFVAYGMIFYFFIKDENILNFVLLIVTFISIANSGYLVSPSLIKQHLVYSIISYFTISVFPLSFLTFFTINGQSLEHPPLLFATRDYDFSYPLYLNYEPYFYIAIMILVVIVCYCASLYYRKNRHNRLQTYKIDPYDSITHVLRLVFSTNDNKTKQGIDLGDGDYILLCFNTIKEKNKFLSSIKNTYNIFEFYQYKEMSYQGAGVHLPNVVNHITSFSIRKNFDELFSGYEKNHIYEISKDFNTIIENSKTINGKDPSWYDEYFLAIAYLLNEDIQFLVLEWIGILDNNTMQTICDIARARDKNLIIVTSALREKVIEKNYKKKKNKESTSK